MTADENIKTANIIWDADAPRSLEFQDVYFSGAGLDETDHIFLRGNALPDRFEHAKQFAIGELGFGTGLNFLCAWRAWRRTVRRAPAALHYLSFEAFPLTASDLERAHRAWPELDDLATRLRVRLPPLTPGFHRIALEHDVTLTLYYGDALAGLRSAEARVDAWFFDGFAPAKNPDMWSPEIFKAVARLCANDATFATFTVAGAVRRALQDAGFAVEKRAGFGRKKEMLGGRRQNPSPATKRRPWFDTRAGVRIEAGGEIAVIGAGIAGASLAWELRRAGFDAVIYEAREPACSASGNPAGLIMPRLDVADTPAGRFHRSAYFYTLGLINAALEGESDSFYNPCGAHLYAMDDKERRRQEKLHAQHALPETWMELRENGLFFPQGGVINPKGFVNALLKGTKVENENVIRLKREDKKWRIISLAGDSKIYDAVIVANALDALKFEQLRSLPLVGSVGQVDWFPDITPPDHAQAFGPYAAPAPGGGVVIGATYAPVSIGKEPDFTSEATKSNIDAVRRALPAFAEKLAASRPVSRASIRCTTPDRLPVAGPVPDWGYYGGAYDGLRSGRREEYPPGEPLPGLYALTGLGSRGLVTAPLAAAMIASELTAAPSPVDIETAEALHPARFFIRDLKRS